MAPELLRFESYGLKVDVYSLGIVLLEMIDAKLVCKHLNRVNEDIRCGRRSDIWVADIKEVDSPSLREFLSACLQIKPEDRATALELLEVRFLPHLSDCI